RYRAEAWNAFVQLKKQCDQICGRVDEEYESVRDMMLADVTPVNGQYALPNENLRFYSIFYPIIRIPFFNIMIKKYQWPSVPDTVGKPLKGGGYYVNAYGVRDTVVNNLG